MVRGIFSRVMWVGRATVFLCLAVVLASTLVWAAQALAVGGDLDSSFSGDGKVETNVGDGGERAADVALQPDGKVVAVGSLEEVIPSGSGTPDSRIAVVRYTPGGAPDASFGGGDGKVITGVGPGPDYATSVAIQPDGKIVVAGQSGDDFALVRYKPNGALDTSFGGGDGRVMTDFGKDESVSDLAIQPDGKLVVAGRVWGVTVRFALVRYTQGGGLDPNFGGGDGKVFTDVGPGEDWPSSLALQPDGKIAVAGRSGDQFAVVRYKPNGALDSAFDQDGKVLTDVGPKGFEGANALALQPDGKLVAAGSYTDTSVLPWEDRFALVRYTPEGTLDSDFGGGDGKVFANVFPDDEWISAVALQPDGRIVVAGAANNGGGISHFDFAVARYRPQGALDTSFGGGDGKVLTDAGSGFEDIAWGLALQPDGRLVVAGSSRVDAPNRTPSYRFVVARYLGA